MRQLRGPLARREFRLYFAGNVASNVGSWLANVALSVYVLDLTNSSFWVGLTNAALFVPVSPFGAPAGSLSARTDRTRLLGVSRVAASGFAAVLALLVGIGEANRYVVVVLAAGLGLTIAVAIPAMQSM